MNELEQKEKKVRWNISKAMSCVYEVIKESKLKIKESKEYTQAMKRLMELYKISKIQVWVICIACERYLADSCITSMKTMASDFSVPVMSIMGWKGEIAKLIDMGLIEWDGYNVDFKPADGFCNSIYDNTEFVPNKKNENDDVKFISYVANRYERRRRDNISSWAIQRELAMYEYKYYKLPVVQRVSAVIRSSALRYFLYDMANDVMEGYESRLDRTVADMWDGNERYNICKDMMEEKHEVFQKGLVEFLKKGNLSEATITLTSKGKQLLFGENANLFEEKINEKDLIKTESIKPKQLFYSKENQKEIDNLKNALQEDTLKNIQKRLGKEGLPIGVAVLLYGAPGTGKTETVLQIAKETNRSIVHVDISESKSAWFGESEKRIKKIFTSYKNTCEVCEKRGEKMPILLFNEADAIISKRKDSTSGNVAQTENAIQNIILEELENLKGIFIATTNLVDNMDSAFERRFLFKIKFENPSKESKTSIWMNKLSWIDKRNAEEFAAAYDFSGGQIDNIVRKIAMNEIISGERPCVSDIHDMCKAEKIQSVDHTKRIGFGV